MTGDLLERYVKAEFPRAPWGELVGMGKVVRLIFIIAYVWGDFLLAYVMPLVMLLMAKFIRFPSLR